MLPTVTLVDKLVQRTLELLEIPSVTGQEGDIAKYLENWAACHDRIKSRRIGNNVVIIRPGEPAAPVIGLLGHLDTVPPHPEQATRRQGDRIFGCGASDMKSGLSVMLELLTLPVRASLVLVCYAAEEGPYTANGLRCLLAMPDMLPKIDLALVLEPTANVIGAGCMGNLHATVTFSGRRAHSARPWQGENAIYRAGNYLQRLAAFGKRPVKVGELTFYEVMNATTAQTANARNVIPDVFSLNVNYRFAPDKTLALARQELVDLLAGMASAEITDEAPAGAVCSNHPLLEAWRKRNALAIAPKQAWTDVAQLTARDIPAVNFGPGDPALAHQADEYVEIGSLVRSFELLRDLLKEAS
ncbi:MAG: succinyl-diaminopimelate desuccinylase [Cyanobacteria bacterium NC_groundwater_1444_Ag_S-0.65um_54_12]|nr:succinyl-diaminopimelate desuccinylase [Cyanobacteria bacterium NC_groundwater_1444_Ag_S-0.65um_54_12]